MAVLWFRSLRIITVSKFVLRRSEEMTTVSRKICEYIFKLDSLMCKKTALMKQHK